MYVYMYVCTIWPHAFIRCVKNPACYRGCAEGCAAYIYIYNVCVVSQCIFGGAAPGPLRWDLRTLGSAGPPFVQKLGCARAAPGSAPGRWHFFVFFNKLFPVLSVEQAAPGPAYIYIYILYCAIWQ